MTMIYCQMMKKMKNFQIQILVMMIISKILMTMKIKKLYIKNDFLLLIVNYILKFNVNTYFLVIIIIFFFPYFKFQI